MALRTQKPEAKDQKNTTAAAPSSSSSSASSKSSASSSTSSTSSKSTPSTPKSTSQADPKADLATQFARGNVTLKQVLGLSRDQMERLKTRAHELLHANELGEAKAMLEGIVAFDPYDVWALVALARVAITQKNLALAQKLVDRALTVRPDDDDALKLQMKLLTG